MVEVPPLGTQALVISSRANLASCFSKWLNNYLFLGFFILILFFGGVIARFSLKVSSIAHSQN
jgi:hypothetical protein